MDPEKEAGEVSMELLHHNTVNGPDCALEPKHMNNQELYMGPSQESVK